MGGGICDVYCEREQTDMIATGVRKGRGQAAKASRVRVLLEQLSNIGETAAEDTLFQLFGAELNYKPCEFAISRDGWCNDVSAFCLNDPRLIAVAAEDSVFHVVHVQLKSVELNFGWERSVIGALIDANPHALFVFSNVLNDRWHFVNAKSAGVTGGALILRRIMVTHSDRLTMASQLLTGLDLSQLGNDTHGPDLQAVQELHERAFDVEQIQRKFFQAFIEVYSSVLADVRLSVDDRRFSADLTQGLLDRLILAYFIQRKGWFANNCFYLNDQLQAILAVKDSDAQYFAQILEPLFDRLAGYNPQAEETLLTPSLSGVFSISPEARAVYRSISDQTYSFIFSELLERFNFTVAENTLLDEELSIDPEMLGKIFEQVILQRNSNPEADLRKTSGSFYTPRVIVHLMSQQALTVYLTNFLSNALDLNCEALQGRIEQLLALPPAEQLDEECIGKLHSLISADEAEILKQAIYECRVCDPAIGSGAFIIGIMQEMESLMARLDLRLSGSEEIGRRNYRYDVKRHLIESSLYGVDIQEQAVRQCELRLWLSLLVDLHIDEDADGRVNAIPHLPTLAHRVVVADSLLEQFVGRVLMESPLLPRCDNETHEVMALLSRDKASYLHETDNLTRALLALKIELNKLRLARQIIDGSGTGVRQTQLNLPIKANGGTATDVKRSDEIQAAILRQASEILQVLHDVAGIAGSEGQAMKHSLDAGAVEPEHLRSLAALLRRLNESGTRTFAWQTEFAEIFGSRNGFDIVIGNPPYRGNGLRGNKRSDPQWTEHVRRLFPGSAEYKIEQYALFFELALRITNSSGTICFVTPDSFLLGMYFQKVRRSILKSSAIRSIVQFEKDFWKSGVVGRPTITLLERSGTVGDVRATLVHDERDLIAGKTQAYSYPQSYFNSVPLRRFRLFFAPVARKYVSAIERDQAPLKAVARIWSGVRSKIGQQKIQSREKHDEEWRKGITTSSLVLPLKSVEWDGEYLHLNKDILWSGGWDATLVEAPKVVIRQTGDTLIAGLDYQGLYHLNNVHGLSLLVEPRSDLLGNARSLEFICALLNSRLMRRFYHLISQEFGRTMAQTDIETLELLPLKEPSLEFVREVSSLVSRPCPESVERINQMFEELYELDDELIAYLRQEEFYPDSSREPYRKEALPDEFVMETVLSYP